MKKIFLPIALILGASAPGFRAQAETKPSIVVEHWYGNDSYHVHTDDYNTIRIDDNTYTLVSNHPEDPSKPDITLDYNTYPTFYVANKDSGLTTSVEEVATDPARSCLTYSAATKSLTSSSDEELTVAVYNMSGIRVLSGYVSSHTPFSVALLPAGVYIAVGIDNNDNPNHLKFSLN